MYTGSFAASLKGIACTRGFVILPACVSTSIFLLSPVEAFLLFPFTGLYMLRFRLIGECQPVSPTAGEQRFDSVTQHNQLHGFILQNLHRYSWLLMQWLGMTLQRAAVNQSSRVYHRLQRSGSCTLKGVGIGANPKSVTRHRSRPVDCPSN